MLKEYNEKVPCPNDDTYQLNVGHVTILILTMSAIVLNNKCDYTMYF